MLRGFHPGVLNQGFSSRVFGLCVMCFGFVLLVLGFGFWIFDFVFCVLVLGFGF